jgi:hypothetical protein
MPNVKISALPLFTGNTQGAEIVMNDSTGATTYRVKKENFTTPSAGFSWVNPGSGGAYPTSAQYGNMTNGIDNYIPWNSVLFNTNTDVFELVNSGSVAGTNANQGARIHFKQPGIYEITTQIHFFDFTSNVDILVRVSSSTTSGGAMSSITLLNDYKSVEAAAADQIINATLILEVTAAGYYSVCMNPSAQSPFPSDANNTPTRIFVKKIS